MSATTPERLEVIDALRGAALFGVLYSNMLWFAGLGNALSAAQAQDFVSGPASQASEYFLDLFVSGKAIGIFTFLFGFGFWMQTEALQRRGRLDAGAVRWRRMAALLALGLVHWVVWSGEILHVYAVAGVLLMLAVRWRARTLLIAGIGLAVLSRPLLTRVLSLLAGSAYSADALGDAALAQRTELFQHGGFLDLVRIQLVQDVWPQLLSGFWLAGVGHALGRFMIGAVIAKGRYFQSVERYRRPMLAIVLTCFPLGWFAQRDWLLKDWLSASGWAASEESINATAQVWNSLGVTAMTAAYICAFVLIWQIDPLRRLQRLLVPAGRMALTNYLLQTPINYLLFCGFGLGLIGKLRMAGCLLISTAVFAAQVLFSRFWLSRMAMGPTEWIWRWWTYGTRPPFRLARAECTQN
jgi:uncharacterized protein